MIPYEYVDRRGAREMTDWPLDRRQRRALNRKIDFLRQVDWRQASAIVYKVKGAGIYKIKVKGNVQLRPRLCFGPADPKTEVTFLVRVTKKDNKESPADASSTAIARVEEIRADPSRRVEI